MNAYLVASGGGVIKILGGGVPPPLPPPPPPPLPLLSRLELRLLMARNVGADVLRSPSRRCRPAATAAKLLFTPARKRKRAGFTLHIYRVVIHRRYMPGGQGGDSIDFIFVAKMAPKTAPTMAPNAKVVL